MERACVLSVVAAAVAICQESETGGPPRFGLDTGLFLALFGLGVWWVVDPRLIHHSIGITTCYYPFSFHTGWAFFDEHASRPGGLVEYGSRLLTQVYGFGWLGALILTAVASCLLLGADDVSRCAGRDRGKFLRYVPAGILLVMCAAYNHPLGAVLSLLAALSGFVLYVRLAPRATTARVLTLVLASVVLYWAAGAGSLLFPLLAASHDLLIEGRKLVAAAALLCGLIVPWALGMLLGLEAWRAYASFLFFDPGVWPPHRWVYTLALYVFFPALLVGTVVWQRSLARLFQRQRSLLDRRESLLQIVTTASAFLAVGAAGAISLDRFTRTVLEIDYYSQHEQWAEVLEAADTLPSAGAEVRSGRNTMLALHHTGLLGDAMFRYPQVPAEYWLSTPRGIADFSSEFQESRLLLELGHVNHAEASAHDALEICGDLPAVLEQLAVIHVVKDRPEMARVFLHALGQHLFFGETARQMLEQLEIDPRLDDDPRVARIRRNMLLKDTFASKATVEPFLQPLLERNPQNTMATDLLLAYYLSAVRPEKAVDAIQQMEGFASARIPRHYQEAMVICMDGLGGLRQRLDPAVVARGEEFLRIVKQAQSREEAANASLAAGFGDSYFYYFTMARWGR